MTQERPSVVADRTEVADYGGGLADRKLLSDSFAENESGAIMNSTYRFPNELSTAARLDWHSEMCFSV